MARDLTPAHAAALDAADPLARFRTRFHIPPGQIYLKGNGLGLASREAEAAVLQALAEWKQLAHDGWFGSENPWLFTAERLGALMAPLVGAGPDEVVATGATTQSLANLVATFYSPAGVRTKILADELNFPSDLFALQSQVRLRGYDPAGHLVLVCSRDGHCLEEDDIIAAMTPDVALVVLPTVLHKSGQLLDVARLTRAAHERGLPIGWDASHSAGAVPHRFDEWGVDFAVWCTYKYLNGGPGSISGLYVNRRHFGRMPAVAGWFGTDPDRQFSADIDYRPAATARAWCVSSPHVFSAAALCGSLALVAEAGVEQLRARSLALTDYLIDLCDALLAGVRLVSPREPERRGGHVVLEHPDAGRIVQGLKARGIHCAFKPPVGIRIAPGPLYTTFGEIWQAVQAVREILLADSGS